MMSRQHIGSVWTVETLTLKDRIVELLVIYLLLDPVPH